MYFAALQDHDPASPSLSNRALANARGLDFPYVERSFTCRRILCRRLPVRNGFVPLRTVSIRPTTVIGRSVAWSYAGHRADLLRLTVYLRYSLGLSGLMQELYAWTHDVYRPMGRGICAAEEGALCGSIPLYAK